MSLFLAITLFYWLLVNFNFSKTLLVLLVCLSFIGQAIASTMMSYHMISMSSMKGKTQPKNMPMMDHSQHNMMISDVDSSESNTENCCDHSCTCIVGSCSSIAVMLEKVNVIQPFDLSSKINSIVSLAPSQQPTSLYRPPILS